MYNTFINELLIVNVLEDMNIRNGIKAYSSWPTIPQLYVGGEFVGYDLYIYIYNIVFYNIKKK